MFVEPSIWDIPLVKPRFGCTFHTEGEKGANFGELIGQEIAAFKLGAKCERGFKAIGDY